MVGWRYDDPLSMGARFDVGRPRVRNPSPDGECYGLC